MDPFVGEIRAVGFSFAPNNWAMCDGSVLPINRYTALFSILGTTYGGDGKTTFALPDLRGRAIVNAGRGQGLANYPLGAQAGTEKVVLTKDQVPPHVHVFGGNFNVSTVPGDQTQAAHNFLAVSPSAQYAAASDPNTTMAAGMIAGTGGLTGNNEAHTNLQPYLALNYVIALTGIFPQRS